MARISPKPPAVHHHKPSPIRPLYGIFINQKMGEHRAALAETAARIKDGIAKGEVQGADLENAKKTLANLQSAMDEIK